MARQDRLAADLERGIVALEAGRVDDAAKIVERCQGIDRTNPDVIALAAGVADARGEVETALGLYRSLIEAHPDDATPRICIARLQLRDLDDPDAALDTLDGAFEMIDDEIDLVEAIIVRTDALLRIDDLENARATLAELTSSAIDDPHVAFDLADLAIRAEDPSSAARYIEVARKAPELEADALHLLGCVHELREEREAMIVTWQKVRELDAKAPPGDVSISEDEIERIALATLDELPADVRDKLGKVPILIDDLPSEELVADGLDPRLLGLFQGTPMADDLAPVVTNILLFRRNLERVAVDLDHLAEEIRVTVLHETAHYFGLEEEDLERLGLD